MKKIYLVEKSESKVRLDKFLVRKNPGYSRNFFQKLIKQGQIWVNQEKVSPHYQIRENDQIAGKIPSSPEIKIQPEKIPLKIIYENQNLLLIDKPSGLVVHPLESGRYSKESLVNALLAHLKNSLSKVGGPLRPGIVHRLDKDASGLLIIAKNDSTHHFLQKQFKNREVTKIYWTLVKGTLKPEKGSIEAPILRDFRRRKKFFVSPEPKAKTALTHYRILKYFAKPAACSLVEVQIVTGRTHQIRVHFAAISHPLIGDPIYGDFRLNKLFEKYGLERIFLHAQKLGFRLPGDHQKTYFEIKLPAELNRFLTQLS